MEGIDLMNAINGSTKEKSLTAEQKRKGRDAIDDANSKFSDSANQTDFWAEMDDELTSAEMAEVKNSGFDNQDSRPEDSPFDEVPEVETSEPICSEIIESGLKGLRAFSEIEKRDIEWLWPSFLPKGALTVISGDPDVGKGFLWVDLVSRITTGQSWPTGERCETGNCMVFHREDDPGSTLKQRLEVAEADQRKVFHLTTLPDENGEERSINLRFHLEQVERLVTDYKIKFIVLDPVQDFWSGVNWNKGEEVRAVLMPLAEMLQRTGVTCLGICHSNKGSDRSAKDSVAGSKQIVACARVVFRADKIPDSESFALTIVKNNLAPHKKLNWELRLEKIDPNNDREVPWVEWVGQTNLRADDFTRTKENRSREWKREDAREFLKRILANGMMPATAIKEAARGAAISETTLERAKRDLDYEDKRIKDCSYWMTPEQKQEFDRQSSKLTS